MGRKYDLVVFDMDGTLTRNIRSSWSFVHEYFGVDNEESYKAYVNGEIDEMEFMRRDIALWMNAKPGITENDIRMIVRDIPLVDGLQETIACLKYNGIKSVICSGGVEVAAEMISNEFGFDGFAADGLEKDSEGRLTGEGILSVDLADKGVRTRGFMDQFKTTKERTVSIGNSFTDIKMFESTGLSIAFNPIDEWTEKAASHVVKSKNLSDILDFIIDAEGESYENCGTHGFFGKKAVNRFRDI